MPIPTPHINAPAGAFADTVLMPGDPLRSKMIAEKFLENPELVNHPHVSCTPHIGSGTKEAQKGIGAELIEIIEAFAKTC